MHWLMIPLIAINLVMVGIIALILRKCYMIAGVDEAIFRSGWGAPEVVTAEGILVYPVVHRIQKLKLVAVPIQETFTTESPLVFADGVTKTATFEIWVRIATSRDELLEAFQELGEDAGEENCIRRYIGSNFRHAILRDAAKSDSTVWLENPKESCWKAALEDLNEHFLTVSQVTVELGSS